MKRIYIKVIPRSSRNEVQDLSKGEYKIKITAPPIGGEANKMLLKVLSDYFKIPKSSINIVGGKTARTKIVDIIN